MRRSFQFVFTCLLLFFISKKIAAQPNDSAKFHSLKANLGGTINRTAEGFAYLLQHNASYQYREARNAVNVRGQHIFGQSLGQVTNRDYNFGFDYNRFLNENRRWYVWFLGAYNSSYSLRVLSQWQAGAGIALNVIDRSDMWLNVSNGIIYEYSEIVDASEAIINYNTPRNSLRINFGGKFQDRIEYKTLHFWQPSLRHANDFIFTSNSSISYQIWNGLRFQLSFIYNKVSKTAKENMVFTYGIAWSSNF